MAKILNIKYVVSNPHISPTIPTQKTTKELIPKFILIYMLFINVGILEFVSWTVAIKTGPVDSKNNPIKESKKIL